MPPNQKSLTRFDGFPDSGIFTKLPSEPAQSHRLHRLAYPSLGSSLMVPIRMKSGLLGSRAASRPSQRAPTRRWQWPIAPRPRSSDCSREVPWSRRAGRRRRPGFDRPGRFGARAPSRSPRVSRETFHAGLGRTCNDVDKCDASRSAAASAAVLFAHRPVLGTRSAADVPNPDASRTPAFISRRRVEGRFGCRNLHRLGHDVRPIPIHDSRNSTPVPEPPTPTRIYRTGVGETSSHDFHVSGVPTPHRHPIGVKGAGP